MTGILELFALAELGSGIGFLVRWRKQAPGQQGQLFPPAA